MSPFPHSEHGWQLAAEYWPGLSREQYEEWIDGYGLAQAEWAVMVGERPNRRSVALFYRECYGLAVELLRSAQPPGTWGAESDRGNVALPTLLAAGCREVLDFGGGLAGTAMFLAGKGFAVGLYELGHTAELAAWRLKRHGLLAEGAPEPGMVSMAPAPLARSWDAILALDVLEHTWEPLALLHSFREVLPPGGILALTRHSFKEHPTHLARTFWLFEALDDVLGELGFRPASAPDGHYGIGTWLRGEDDTTVVQESPESGGSAAREGMGEGEDTAPASSAAQNASSRVLGATI